MALYLQLGRPGVISAPPAAVPAAYAGAHDTSGAQIAMMVEGLAQKLAEDPENPEAWVMLARSYNGLGRHGEALDAYRKAQPPLPDDAALLADYADALAMTQQGRLQGKPMQLVRQALKLEAHNLKALALAGTDAFDRRDFRGAASWWEKALKGSSGDAEFSGSLRASIEEARSLAGEQSSPATAKFAPPPAGVVQVSGRIEVSPSLKPNLPSEGTLFIFARAENGPRMPVTILRASVNDLPM